MGQHWRGVPHSILKWMAKPNKWIVVLKLIYSAFVMNIQPSGISVYCGLNYGYNTTFYSSARITPFKVVYGCPPPLLVLYGDRKTTNNSIEQLLKERDLVISALKENLVVAHNQMKKKINLHGWEMKLKTGDEVYLKLRQRYLARKRSEKLAPKFYGPYHIIEEIGKVVYRLDLPPKQ